MILISLVSDFLSWKATRAQRTIAYGIVGVWRLGVQVIENGIVKADATYLPEFAEVDFAHSRGEVVEKGHGQVDIPQIHSRNRQAGVIDRHE